MKTTKKLISMLLICLLLTGTVSLSAFADGNTLAMSEVWSMMGSSVFSRDRSTLRATGEAGNETLTFEDADVQTIVVPVSGLELSYDEVWDSYSVSVDDFYFEIQISDGAIYLISICGVFDPSDDYTYDYDGTYIDPTRERDGSFYYPWHIGATAEDYLYAYYDCGFLTVCGTGEMADFEQLADRPWNDLASEIYNISIEDGVGSIGKNAFNGLGDGNAFFLTIGQDVSYIGDSAFESINTTEEMQLWLPTALTEIGSRAFAGLPVTDMLFLGGKADIAEDAFAGITANVCYLYDSGWEEADLKNFGGELTYTLCYVFETEDVYSDGETSGSSTVYVPDGQLVISLDYSDCQFLRFELIEGTLPEGIDFTDPELCLQMVDNIKLRVYYRVDGDDSEERNPVIPIDPQPVPAPAPIGGDDSEAQAKGSDADSPETSDETDALLWLGVLLVSAAILTLTSLVKRKN